MHSIAIDVAIDTPVDATTNPFLHCRPISDPQAFVIVSETGASLPQYTENGQQILMTRITTKAPTTSKSQSILQIFLSNLCTSEDPRICYNFTLAIPSKLKWSRDFY